MSRQEPTVLGERFGANLLHNRRRAGLSQERLAELVGMHRVSVSVLERGLCLPRIDTILQLAAGTNASASVLLEGMEWRPARHVDGDFYVFNHFRIALGRRDDKAVKERLGKRVEEDRLPLNRLGKPD